MNALCSAVPWLALKATPGPARARQAGRGAGFTLIELMVVIAIIALLAALLLPAITRAKESARSAQCLSQMRQIGVAMRLYADANNDEIPRSQHSAFAHGQLPWGRAIAPELGQTDSTWTNLLGGLYHCPGDPRKAAWSYGQNVYFELDPETDDYTGSPQTWRRVASVPKPAATVLYAENVSNSNGSMGADHIMAHFWTSLQDALEVERCRHRARSNYGFMDGHAQSREFTTTYWPAVNVDCWNPVLAQ